MKWERVNLMNSECHIEEVEMRINYKDITKVRDKTKVTKISILISSMPNKLIKLIKQDDNFIWLRTSRTHIHFYTLTDIESTIDLIGGLNVIYRTQ